MDIRAGVRSVFGSTIAEGTECRGVTQGATEDSNSGSICGRLYSIAGVVDEEEKVMGHFIEVNASEHAMTDTNRTTGECGT